MLAGPGTGKTSLIVARIRAIIGETIDSKNRILALTFTNKAAAELKERVRVAGVEAQSRLFVGTFHSFGSYVLRTHGDSLGISPNFVQFDEEDRSDLVASLQAKGLISTRASSSTILRTIDHAKGLAAARGIRAEQLPGLRPETVDLLDTYNASMKKAGALDFGDLVYQAALLLTTHPEVQRLIQVTFRHVLVDEFQDTTPGQYYLLQRLLTGGSGRIFAVADEDQLIYEWNEARLETINHLLEDFKPSVGYATLTYRCPPDVVRAANAVISRNRLRFPNKPAIQSDPARHDSGPIRRISSADEDGELEAVSREIRDLLAEGEKPEECAIIARAGWLLDNFESSLPKMGVPASRPTLGGVGATEEAEFVFRLLRWILSPRDEQSARRVTMFLSPSVFEVSEARLDSSRTGASYYESDLADAVRGRPDGDMYLRFMSEVSNWRLGAGNARLLLSKIEGRANELLDEFGVSKDSAEIVTEDVRRLSQHARAAYPYGRVSLSDYLLEIPRLVGEDSHGGEQVPLLTYHQAKGLEFSNVFLVGLEEGILPDYRALEHPRTIEEERRLFYVGITRTKRRLFLSSTKSRSTQKGYQVSKPPSRFIGEIPEELIKEN